MDLTAFNSAPLRALGVLSSDGALVYKSVDVRTALRDDYANRTARSNRSQFRTVFDQVSNFDGVADGALMYNARQPNYAPFLDTTFTVP